MGPKRVKTVHWKEKAFIGNLRVVKPLVIFLMKSYKTQKIDKSFTVNFCLGRKKDDILHSLTCLEKLAPFVFLEKVREAGALNAFTQNVKVFFCLSF